MQLVLNIIAKVHYLSSATISPFSSEKVLFQYNRYNFLGSSRPDFGKSLHLVGTALYVPTLYPMAIGYSVPLLSLARKTHFAQTFRFTPVRTSFVLSAYAGSQAWSPSVYREVVMNFIK